MSATTPSAMDESHRLHMGKQAGRCGSRGEHRDRWTPANTVAVVLGFVFFGPFGLLVLFWVLSGRHVRDIPQAARDAWSTVSGMWEGGPRERVRSDNLVFDDYQRTQYDRIREIRDEIVERARRFSDYRSDAKRRADQDEFDRFMASTPDRQAS